MEWNYFSSGTNRRNSGILDGADGLDADTSYNYDRRYDKPFTPWSLVYSELEFLFSRAKQRHQFGVSNIASR